MATFAELLVQIQEVIATILQDGQARDSTGRLLTSANLKELEQRERDLELRITRQTINAVMQHGQAHDVNGRRLTRADLGQLQARERALKLELARVTRGGIKMTQVVPRG